MSLNLSEALLQLACKDGGQYTIESSEKEYVMLNERAQGDYPQHPSSFQSYLSNPLRHCVLAVLKLKLSHIPDQIEDRSQFLQIIRCVV